MQTKVSSLSKNATIRFEEQRAIEQVQQQVSPIARSECIQLFQGNFDVDVPFNIRQSRGKCFEDILLRAPCRDYANSKIEDIKKNRQRPAKLKVLIILLILTSLTKTTYIGINKIFVLYTFIKGHISFLFFSFKFILW
jgi:hypothetical protein